MKKSHMAMLTAVLFLFILLIPIPSGVVRDGGTRTFTALTYKIIKWNRNVDADEIYTDVDVYFLPDNFKSIEELWVEKEIHVEADPTESNEEEHGESDERDAGGEDSAPLAPDADSSNADPSNLTDAASSDDLGEYSTVLSEKVIKSTYILSTKKPYDLSSFKVERVVNDKANVLIENLISSPNVANKSENGWVKFSPSHPNEYALAIDFTDGTCLIIAVHFTKEGRTYYIATAQSNSPFDAQADYTTLHYQRGIASAELGKYLGDLTVNYSE